MIKTINQHVSTLYELINIYIQNMNFLTSLLKYKNRNVVCISVIEYFFIASICINLIIKVKEALKETYK